jgi:hypothetical protein
MGEVAVAAGSTTPKPVVSVERDYTRGFTTRFSEEFPPELESYVCPRLRACVSVCLCG